MSILDPWRGARIHANDNGTDTNGDDPDDPNEEDEEAEGDGGTTPE